MIRNGTIGPRESLDRLQWTLSQPLLFGDSEWPHRLKRALLGFRNALDQHVDSLQATEVLSHGRSDPFCLPFLPNPLPKVCEQRSTIQKRVTLLLLQLDNAAMAITAPPGSATAVQAFRSLLRVARDAERLAADLQDSLADQPCLTLSGG